MGSSGPHGVSLTPSNQTRPLGWLPLPYPYNPIPGDATYQGDAGEVAGQRDGCNTCGDDLWGRLKSALTPLLKESRHRVKANANSSPPNPHYLTFCLALASLPPSPQGTASSKTQSLPAYNLL